MTLNRILINIFTYQPRAIEGLVRDCIKYLKYFSRLFRGCLGYLKATYLGYLDFLRYLQVYLGFLSYLRVVKLLKGYQMYLEAYIRTI